MSSNNEQIIKKKVHHVGVIKKRSNHILFEDIDTTEKVLIKPQKKPEQKSQSKPAPREMLDNYRYLETKEIKSKEERRGSIVKHKRLSKPIGKETPYERASFRDYKTNTTYVQKRPKFGSYDSQKTNKQTQNKYSEKTSNLKKNYGEKSNKSRQHTNSQSSKRAEKYSSKTTKVQKLVQTRTTERKFSNRNANNRRNANERNQETNQPMKREENAQKEEQNMNERQQLNKGDNQDYIQQRDTYDYRTFNLEQNRINERASNQGQVLPFYPPGQENKYRSLTEKLVICRTCGKPKKPKQLQITENYNQMRNSITREIIGEQSPQGDYFIRYSTQGELNQPSSSQFELQGQGNETQQRLDEISASKTHYCPVHGYI
jgi:hypothetical protein